MGIIYNDIRYLNITYDNNSKQNSLEDNVYFTLKDIFCNIKNARMAIEINIFMDILTNGVCLEKRGNKFRYSKILMNKIFVNELKNFLGSILRCDFEFDTIYRNTSLKDYISFGKWNNQLNELIDTLHELYYDL